MLRRTSFNASTHSKSVLSITALLSRQLSTLKARFGTSLIRQTTLHCGRASCCDASRHHTTPKESCESLLPKQEPFDAPALKYEQAIFKEHYGRNSHPAQCLHYGLSERKAFFTYSEI